MSINYLDKTGLAYFWGKIKAAFVQKEAGKGLSSNDYTAAEKTKLAGLPAAGNILTVSDKGAANGVAPLNAYGVIPGEYIPGGGDEDIYLVNVAIALDRSPTTYDSEAVKDIPNHNNTFLRLTNGLNTNNAVFQYKYGGTYIFWCAFAVGTDSYDIVTYNVDTENGTITKENIFTKPDDYIISRDDAGGWTYERYNSGIVKAYKKREYSNKTWNSIPGVESIVYTDCKGELPTFIRRNSNVVAYAQMRNRNDASGHSQGLMYGWIASCLAINDQGTEDNGIYYRCIAPSDLQNANFIVVEYIIGQWNG